MGQVHCIKNQKIDNSLKCTDIQTMNSMKYEYCPPPAIKIEYHSQNGYGNRKLPNQDVVSIYENLATETHLVSILDGFGPCGRRVADYSASQLSNYLYNNKKRIELAANSREIQKEFKIALKEAENKLQQCDLDTDLSGCTFVGILLEKTRIHTVNIGTGKAILARHNLQNDQREIIELSSEHTLERNDEVKRLEATGLVRIKKGVDINDQEFGRDRVYMNTFSPGLTATRALGSFKWKKILESEPDIDLMDLSVHDKFIIVGSDGLWDAITPTEAVNFVYKRFDDDNVARSLCDYAFKKWKEYNSKPTKYFIGVGDEPIIDKGCDDISAAIIFLEFIY